MGFFKNPIKSIGNAAKRVVTAPANPKKAIKDAGKHIKQATIGNKGKDAIRKAGRDAAGKAASESAAFGREMARQGAERLRVNTEKSKNRRAALRGRTNNRRSLLGADDEQGSATLG